MDKDTQRKLTETLDALLVLAVAQSQCLDILARRAAGASDGVVVHEIQQRKRRELETISPRAAELVERFGSRQSTVEDD